MYYYSHLLLTGNDLYPQSDDQITFFIIVIFCGAFMEAYIMGSFTQAMSTMQKDKKQTDQVIEYVKFSMEIHKLRKFIQYQGENIEVQTTMLDF